MKVLSEAGLGDELEELDRAWSSPETFAVIPAKSPISVATVNAWLESLPAPFVEGGFALLTSGSTGRPKLVVGMRARAELLAARIHEAQVAAAVSTAVLVLPLSYSYAFVNQWVWARAHRRKLIPTRGMADPERLVETLSSVRDAMLCLVGGHAPLLELLGSRVFEGITRLNFAGGPFPASRLGELTRRFPNARFFDNYGCTEAMPRLTVREMTCDSPLAVLGDTLPGVELCLGENDELLFRSETSAVGFVDELGFHTLADGSFISTGDLARRTSTGRIELVGRAGEVFKRYGEKVSLPLLAESVRAAWSRGMAFYRGADRAGESGAVLVLAPRPTDAEVRAVLREIRMRHSRPHWPLRIESVEALPTLANGKIDVRTLESASEKNVHWDQRL
ncbi:MAG: acyl--CoA ligase [Deltaproteobacteria bacterium]|nr:acyl--CoA ligase [Deltaproteobacteria bacterium]